MLSFFCPVLSGNYGNSLAWLNVYNIYRTYLVLLQRALLDDLLDDGLFVVGAELVVQGGVRCAVEAALGAVPESPELVCV